MLSLNRETVKYLRGKHLIDRSTCILIVAFLGAVLFIITAMLLSPPPEDSEEKRDYSECKHQYIDKSLCLPATSDDETKESETKASPASYVPNNYIKEKRDLNAQEGMWRATNTLAYFTLFQIFIGFGGVVVVAITLRQTGEILNEARKTTKAASDATLAANKTAEAAINSERAHVYLTIRAEFVSDDPGDVSKEKFKLIWEIKNYGKTPALQIKYSLKQSIGIMGHDGTIAASTNAGDSSPIANNEIAILGAGDSEVVGQNREAENAMILDTKYFLGAVRKRFFASYYLRYNTILDKTSIDVVGNYEIVALSDTQASVERNFASAESDDDRRSISDQTVPIDSAKEFKSRNSSTELITKENFEAKQQCYT